MESGTVVTVTDATFGDIVLGNERPVVVDFWAEWCKPCVMISKSLGELAEEYGDRLVIAKIDADVNPESVRTYKVMSMPTLLIFSKGDVVGTIVGAKPKASLRKTIDELI
jgi:thioredoxin 1